MHVNFKLNRASDLVLNQTCKVRYPECSYQSYRLAGSECSGDSGSGEPELPSPGQLVKVSRELDLISRPGAGRCDDLRGRCGCVDSSGRGCAAGTAT